MEKTTLTVVNAGPNWMFRVDTRDPDAIFKNGFTAFGQNDNLRDHARGTSCTQRDANSNFISTSSDPEYAGNYARRLITRHGPPIYVYKIRPTENFYNMERSLAAIGYEAGIPDARKQSEWVAVNKIEGSQIQAVRVYRSEQTPPFQLNPRYEERRPDANPGVYKQRTSPAPGNNRWLVSQDPLVTASLSATMHCYKDMASAEVADPSACRFIEELIPEPNTVGEQ
jgi:pertussis toxin subunit 1